MSLKVSNRATPKQEILLRDLGYDGSKWPLTMEEAAECIDGLLDQKKQDARHEQDNYGGYDEYIYSQDELDDPFSKANK